MLVSRTDRALRELSQRTVTRSGGCIALRVKSAVERHSGIELALAKPVRFVLVSLLSFGSSCYFREAFY